MTAAVAWNMLGIMQKDLPTVRDMSSIKRIGAFRLIRPLGDHGERRIYEVHREDGLRAALKILDLRSASRATAVEMLVRFRREACVLQALHHPGVVRLLESGEGTTHAWLALELLPPCDLLTALEGRPAVYMLQPDGTVRLARPAGSGAFSGLPVRQ